MMNSDPTWAYPAISQPHRDGLHCHIQPGFQLIVNVHGVHGVHGAHGAHGVHGVNHNVKILPSGND